MGKLLGVLCVVLAFCANAANTTLAQLDQTTVQKLVTTLDTAIAKRDVDEIGKHLSTGVKIAMTVNSGGKKQTMNYNKAQYLSAMRQELAAASDYQFRRTDLHTELAADKKSATVTSSYVEFFTTSSQTYRTTSRSVSTVELVEGAPMITAVNVEGSVK